MAGNNRDRPLKYLEATFSRGLPTLRKKLEPGTVNDVTEEGGRHQQP